LTRITHSHHTPWPLSQPSWPWLLSVRQRRSSMTWAPRGKYRPTHAACRPPPPPPSRMNCSCVRDWQKQKQCMSDARVSLTRDVPCDRGRRTDVVAPCAPLRRLVPSYSRVLAHLAHRHGHAWQHNNFLPCTTSKLTPCNNIAKNALHDRTHCMAHPPCIVWGTVCDAMRPPACCHCLQCAVVLFPEPILTD
jgi:hypothetical protein